MTVYDEIVRIRVPHNQKLKSVTGKVDFTPHGYDRYTQEKIVQLSVITQHPKLKSSGTKEDLDIELQNLPVCQDAVRDPKTKPEVLRTVYTFVDHPGFDGDRDYLRSRFTQIREHWMNHQELITFNLRLKKQGYTRGLRDWKDKLVNPRNPNQIFYKFLVGYVEYG
jgi:hypothetical protein